MQNINTVNIDNILKDVEKKLGDSMSDAEKRRANNMAMNGYTAEQIADDLMFNLGGNYSLEEYMDDYYHLFCEENDEEN